MNLKKYFIVVLVLCVLPGMAFAVPYASQIRVGSTELTEGQGANIDYFLNQAADTVTIEIVNRNTSSVAATFSGTTDEGANSVTWDGSVNNSGGANIPGGPYRVKITANKNVADGWSQIKSNSSLGNYVEGTDLQTLFSGFSGKDTLISNDPDSDYFGYMFVSSSYSNPAIYGFIVLNPDLTVYDGNDGSDSVMNLPIVTANNQATWGVKWDVENTDSVWNVGQADPNITFAENPFEEDMVDADPDDNATGYSWRGCAPTIEGASKYLYIAANNDGSIYKIDVTGDETKAPFIQIGGGFTTTTYYSKDVEFDSNGNLYWTARNDGGTTGGKVYRFDASVIAAADAAGYLGDATAAWNISVPAADTHTKGIAISDDGDVYVATDQALYLIDNTSTATLTKTLATEDMVLDFSTITPEWSPSGYGCNITMDYGGNIYMPETANEQIRLLSPNGNTSVAVNAPLSQNISVVIPPTPSSGMDTWAIYK